MSAITAAPASARVRRVDVVIIAVGIVVLGAGMLAVRDGTVPSWEASTFSSINDLPDSLYPAVWAVQQLGALTAGLAAALVFLLLRRRRAAVACLIVTVGKLGGERLVKVLVSRQRPGTSIGPDIETRGAVSIRGESFVSGHAILVAGLAAVITPLLPVRWRWVAWATVLIVMAARVYVGAHNPLDVVCGAALGVSLGTTAVLLAPLLLPRSA